MACFRAKLSGGELITVLEEHVQAPPTAVGWSSSDALLEDREARFERMSRNTLDAAAHLLEEAWA